MNPRFKCCKQRQTQFFFQVLVEDRMIKITAFEEVLGPDFVGQVTGKKALYTEQDQTIFTAAVDGKSIVSTIHTRRVLSGKDLDRTLEGKYFVPLSSSCLSFQDPSFPLPLWFGTMLTISITPDGILSPPSSVQNLAKAQAVSGKRYLQQHALKSVLVYTAGANMNSLRDGDLSFFCGKEYGFISNYKDWDVGDNLQATADETKKMLPKILCVPRSPLHPDESGQLHLEIIESGTGLIAQRDCQLIITPICGYFPKRRVQAKNGKAAVPFIALGLQSGDEVQFWAGFESNIYLSEVSVPVS